MEFLQKKFLSSYAVICQNPKVLNSIDVDVQHSNNVIQLNVLMNSFHLL